MIRKSLGLMLNLVTGGAWGAAGWVGRRLKNREGRPGFLSRVAALVASHFVIALLMGSVSLWWLLKQFGRSILYLCVIVLHAGGGDGKLPEEEDAKARGTLAKMKDAVHVIRDNAKAEADDLTRKAAEKAERLKQDTAEHAAKVGRDAEEKIARVGEKARVKAISAASNLNPLALALGLRKELPFAVVCPDSRCRQLMRYAAEDAENDAQCDKCGLEIGRIDRVSRPLRLDGGKVDLTCRFCGEESTTYDRGLTTPFVCVICGNPQYVSEAIAAEAVKRGMTDKYIPKWEQLGICYHRNLCKFCSQPMYFCQLTFTDSVVACPHCKKTMLYADAKFVSGWLPPESIRRQRGPEVRNSPSNSPGR